MNVKEVKRLGNKPRTTKPLLVHNNPFQTMVERRRQRRECTITIRDIRDRENQALPRSALKSIVARISESMEELGIKASIEARES